MEEVINKIMNGLESEAVNQRKIQYRYKRCS